MPNSICGATRTFDAIAAALAETGVELTGICVDPRRSLVDPAQHGELLDAVRDSIAAARQLGSPPLILASGFTREGVSATGAFRRSSQRAETSRRAGRSGGRMLVLEPLNDRVEHPGMYLVSTTLGLDLVEAVEQSEPAAAV